MADPVPPPVPFDIRVKDGEDTSATTPKRSVSIAQSHQTSDTEPVTVLNEKDIEKGGFIQPQTGHDSDADPNIVDFNGPDDPSLAVNWQSSRKWSMVTALSLYTLLTPLASSMFAPGIPELLRDFQSTSMTLGAFVISVYVLGYAAGPMIIAPLSELYGRQPIYHVCNVCFVILTVACALATNINMLIGFRLLAGLAGSATLTLGGGTIADLFVTEERGKAMALWSMGPLLGPVIGPVAGGFLTQAKGWRWVFWIIAIASGVATIICFLVLRESYSIIILEKRTKSLRKQTNNPNLRSALDSGLSPGEAFRRAIIRPSKLLIFSPICLALSLFTAIAYGYLYLVFTTLTPVFQSVYGFSTSIVGLCFVGIGVGMFIGMFVFGALSDRMLKAKAAKTGVMKPEYRLPLLLPGAVFIPVGIFIYGWTAEKHVFWFVPILGTAFLGVGLIGVFMPIQTYLVDAFTIHAASAIAANTIVRSLMGALLPLAGPAMYQTLGLGWGNSLLGFIAMALLPIPVLLTRYGERIRTNPRFQIKM